MKRSTILLARCLGLAALVAFAPSCVDELDTTRTPPARGSVGEEVFGVFCDRVGAQALREDLSGASFRRVCHPWEGGYADKVDTSLLPPIDPNAPDVDAQERQRAKMIGRVESLARRRAELVRALDATIPATKVAVKELDHPDEASSCNGAKDAMLSEAIADMLGRFTSLYHDGTLPRSTQALAKLVESFESSPEARAAWSRLSARQGYRPIETALGAARPVVAYPRLRDLSNTTLRLISADANPYALDPKRDEHGNRVPEPGPGYPAFQGLLDAAHAELLDSKVDPRLPPLVSTLDPVMNRAVLSRPRGTLETMQELLFTADKQAAGTPRFIVRRDDKGFALLAPGMASTSFAGAAPPPPFPFSGVDDHATRDAYGRALAGGKLVYDYIDTNQTYGALLFRELQPLADPKRGTLMDLASGLEASLGARTQREKKFSGGTLKYEGIANDAPILDLVHALGAVLGDKNADATLAMANALITAKQPELARTIGAAMRAFDMAKKHPEATIPRETAVWDDILEVVGKIAAEPGLLEDLLESLADPRIAKNLGAMFSKYAKYRDDITYDINDLNGRPWNATTGSKEAPRTEVDRSKPKTRSNRSELMRFLKLISDVSGVTLCNRPEAKLHAIKTFAGVPISLTLPLSLNGSASYKECEVFKIDDLGVFYLDTIVNASVLPERQNEKVKPGVIYVRDKQLRDGLIQIPFYGPLGAAEVELMELSSGIHGFWTEGRSRVIAPKPEWLNRLAFFDWEKDNVNAQTRKHVEGLTGRLLGSSACPERVIADPLPNEIDAAPDGKVRGLRQCADGDWFQQRNPATIFVWEHFEFYDTMRALLTPFARHGKERLFLDLASKLYKVMPDGSATSQECTLAPNESCTRQGLVSYEPLLVELLGGDLLPAISDLARALKELKIARCETTDAKGACTKVKVVSGIEVAAAATRSTVDPAVAKANGITDRAGNVGTKRNDGKPVAQVTPAYLVTNALSAIDRAQEEYEAKNPGTRERYRRARSDLADQIFATGGGKLNNPLVNAVTPKAIDLLRAQLAARCPSVNARCEWARRDLPRSVEATMTGPLASAGISLVETIRKDPDARRESELLLSYLLDAGSGNDALASVLASASDALQLFADDENLVPLYHVLAAALKKDGGLVDAQMALLSKISGKYIDREGREICKREMDPNQLLAIVLKNVVSPIKDAAFKGQSPLEVIVDVIADVNRADPTGPYDGRLRDEDYTSVSDNVVEFLVDKERGLEQLYEVVRQGTKP